MMDREVVLFVTLVFACLFIINIYFWLDTKDMIINLKNDLIHKSDLNFIDTLNQKFVDNHNYTRNGTNKYNCLNYSKDYAFIMNSLGYDVRVLLGTGSLTNKTPHAWNYLTWNYEPQTNEIRSYDYQKKKEYSLDGVIDYMSN